MINNIVNIYNNTFVTFARRLVGAPYVIVLLSYNIPSIFVNNYHLLINVLN